MKTEEKTEKEVGATESKPAAKSIGNPPTGIYIFPRCSRKPPLFARGAPLGVFLRVHAPMRVFLDKPWQRGPQGGHIQASFVVQRMSRQRFNGFRD